MIFLFLLIISLLFVVYVRKRPGKEFMVYLSFAFSITAILLGFEIFRFYFLTTDHNYLSERLKKKNYQVVEGRVRVLTAQPYRGHLAITDMIQINEKIFNIDFFTSTHAYNQTIAHGGYLRDGVIARIYYYNNKILKIDLREKPN